MSNKSCEKKLSELQEQILQILIDSGKYLPTITIAKEIFGAKGRTSEVNPSLYKLSAMKLVKKKCEDNGGNPQWKARKQKNKNQSFDAPDGVDSADSADHTSKNVNSSTISDIEEKLT